MILFLTVIPSLWSYLSFQHIASTAFHGRRRVRSLLIGRIPYSMNRALLEDTNEALCLTVSCFNLLNRNWLLHVALRVASGAFRARRISTFPEISTRALLIYILSRGTLLGAYAFENMLLIDVPSIFISRQLKISCFLGRPVLHLVFFLSTVPLHVAIAPTDLIAHLASYPPTVSSHPFDAPLISTAPEVTRRRERRNIANTRPDRSRPPRDMWSLA